MTDHLKIDVDFYLEMKYNFTCSGIKCIFVDFFGEE